MKGLEMEIKRMVGGVAKHTKVYELPRLTPNEETPSMRTREEVQQKVCARAEELAVADQHRGPGHFAEQHYHLALREISPADKDIERGLAPTDGDGNQAAAASRHLAEEITRHEHHGYSRDEAIKKATDEERASGLHQTRAALPKDSPWAVAGEKEQQDAARHFSRMTGQRRGEIVAKAYAGPGPLSTTHEEKLRTSRPVLVNQVAASCLDRNIPQPDGHERAWIDAWFGVNVPPPAPIAGTDSRAALSGYNKARAEFISEVMEAARVVLRDPQARAALRPTRLGG